MPAKKNTELAAIDPAKFQIETIETALTADDISEELDGLGTIPLDRAKFPGSGGTTFDITDDENEDEPMPVDSIEGIIVFHHAMNSRWESGFDGTNEPPVCSAINGKVGLNVQTGEVLSCATCPYNEFGSASDGNSKACKNIHRLYISRNGNPVPLVVALPPTSLKSFKNYIAKKLLLKGRKCNQVITRITLKSAKSASNMKYSKAVFEKLGDLNEEQLKASEAIGEFVKGIVAAETPITTDDYNTSASSVEVAADQTAEPPQLPPVSNEMKTYPPAPQEPVQYSKPEVYSAPPIPQEAPPARSTQRIAPPISDGFDFIDVEPSDDNPFG